jgi:hypothetical protein
MTFDIKNLRTALEGAMKRVSSETMGWLAGIVIHAATVPTLLAMITGLSDSGPNLDVVFFMWAGLVLLFFKAVVMRDMLNIVTLSLGFMVQSALMAMLIFK